MEEKKSFILYNDYLELFQELNNNDAGELIKHILKYVNDLDPKSENSLVKLSFIPIKQQLKRDNEKWDKYIKKQSENGKQGGRPKIPKKAVGYLANPTKAKKADTVNVTVNDNVNDTVNDNVTVIKKHISISAKIAKFSEEIFNYCHTNKIDENIGKEFVSYWTELNSTETKFKAEGEKFFSIPHRIGTFVKNAEKFKEKEKGSAAKEKFPDHFSPGWISQNTKGPEGGKLFIDYCKHLRSLGLMPKKDMQGKLIDYVKV